MQSTDRLVAWVLVISAVSALTAYHLLNLHHETMQRIDAAARTRLLSLQVEYEQAKAEQARYRALEVGYLCAMTDGYGETYFSEDCE